MNIKYLFWVLVIILFLINCEFILSTENNDDDSDEDDDEKFDVKFTKEVTPLLSKVYNILSSKNGEEGNTKIDLNKFRSDLSGIYSGNLFQGDIILTTDDAEGFIDAIKKEAKKKKLKISKIVGEIQFLIQQTKFLKKEVEL
uniref:Uncharacterized protein n=1 Tax=Strongyloides venezuelensis TaxID=75913 RepID=A0A0K0F567_STRVS